MRPPGTFVENWLISHYRCPSGEMKKQISWFMMRSFILSEVQKNITTSPDLIFSSPLQTGSVCDLSAGPRAQTPKLTQRITPRDMSSQINQKKIWKRIWHPNFSFSHKASFSAGHLFWYSSWRVCLLFKINEIEPSVNKAVRGFSARTRENWKGKQTGVGSIIRSVSFSIDLFLSSPHRSAPTSASSRLAPLHTRAHRERAKLTDELPHSAGEESHDPLPPRDLTTAEECWTGHPSRYMLWSADVSGVNGWILNTTLPDVDHIIAMVTTITLPRHQTART